MRMTPIVVTATTPAGFVTYEPWSPAIDGILAYSSERERLGTDFGTGLDVRPVEGLPLQRIEWDGLWWYECGLPRFNTLVQHEKHIHRRFDGQEAQDTLPDKRKVITSMGRHKNMRKGRLVSVGPSVSWAAVGDPDEVLRLVSTIPNIGQGWAHGFGRVTQWTVEEREEEILRPVPVDYAIEHGLRGFEAVAAFRPPGWLPGNNMRCLVPTHRVPVKDHHEEVPVIHGFDPVEDRLWIESDGMA